MARVLGIQIADNSRVDYALTQIYGIGWTRAAGIIKQTGVDGTARIGKLSEEDIKKLVAVVESFKVEGNLKEEERENLKRLRDISAYRGIRHLRGLPARGQRTRSNARTKRGKRRTVGALTKEAWSKLETGQQKAAATKK